MDCFFDLVFVCCCNILVFLVFVSGVEIIIGIYGLLECIVFLFKDVVVVLVVFCFVIC